MNVLRLSYEAEDDRHGELHASIRASGFSGHGAAWFDRDALLNFARRLEDHPLVADPPITISGGVDVSPEGLPKHVHLGLMILPSGTAGRLIFRVDLAAEWIQAFPTDLQQRASLCILTDYATLDRFRASFVAMLSGGGEAVLAGLEI